MKFSQVKEADILRSIQKYLKLKNIVHWRMPVGPVVHQKDKRIFWKKNPLKGFPDLAGIVPGTDGRLFVIEVKSETGRLSKEQKEWREILCQQGVCYILAKSIHDVHGALYGFQ